MKVLIVNTSERTGGAAVAANRLMMALINHGVKAKMLVRDKDTDSLTVTSLPQSPWLRWNFLWERFVIFVRCGFSRKHLFEIDLANTGTDITRLREFKEADIIHLHWINQGMLSLSGIRKILRSGKPVVWTMHDIWPATAICHVTLGCRSFTTRCRSCRLLGKHQGDDLSTTVWQRKLGIFEGENIYFVACSRWLEQEAKASALLKGHKITSIPNPIDTHLYNRYNKDEARQRLGLPHDRRLILFASQRVTTPNKGMDYLIEACRLLVEQHPECREQISVAVMGGQADEVVSQLPFRTFPLGYVSSEQRIIQAYQAADVFVLPSLSENLPNTIMEAMACGIPSVAFQIGGIPEEIDHRQNGYVARYRDAADLAEGIWWTLFDANQEEVRRACLQKVARCYSQQRVAEKYIEIYENLHHHHHV